jgi:hypothetical protein
MGFINPITGISYLYTSLVRSPASQIAALLAIMSGARHMKPAKGAGEPLPRRFAMGTLVKKSPAATAPSTPARHLACERGRQTCELVSLIDSQFFRR